MQLNKKRFSVFIIVVMIYSLVAVYGLVPMVNAANSFNDAKATLSDSDLSATATTTITFITGTELDPTDYYEIIVPKGPPGFSNMVDTNITCPDTASTTRVLDSTGDHIITCTINALSTSTPGAKSMVITNATNPGTAGDYTINIATKHASGAEIEKSQVKVYIIDDVTVTASVDASLTFTVAGLDVGDTVNGSPVTATSTATSTPFGTLSTVASSTVGQQLSVSTNATDGYIVTVFQNQELTSAGSANINSFNNSQNGTGSTSLANFWTAPSGILDVTNTYGHMGVTTDDTDLSGVEFGTLKYKGLNGSDPMEVMYYDHPVNGTLTGIGTTKVGYTAQISALQEAGDYTNILTYVCTPQF
jgi:hypothetical protein